MHPPLLHQLVWDSSYEESSYLTNLKSLLTQSLAAPLLPAQQQEVRSDDASFLHPRPDCSVRHGHERHSTSMNG